MKHACTFIAVLLVVAFGTSAPAQESHIDWEQVPERTRVELQRAQQLMNENKFQEAAERLIAYRDRRPKYNHFLVDFNIGTAYGLLGNNAKAIEHLERAAELDQAYAPSWLNLGKLYYQEKMYAEAGTALERGFRASPLKNAEILFMAMAACYQADMLADTIRLGSELVETYNSESIEVISLLANAYVAAENYRDAIAMLERVLDRNPNNVNAWKLITQAYFKNQQYDRAVIAYEIYGYLEPMSREELMIMGDLFAMAGVPARAAQYYERALQEGGTPEEFEKVSVTYYTAYDFANAVAAIDAALKDGPNYERLLLKAQLCYLQDRFGEAQQMYVQAAELMTRDGNEWLMAGYCAMRNGEVTIARELLRRATEFPAQRDEALVMLKMLEPAEEMRDVMAALQEQVMNN